ncbi:conserved hypothetical protein [Theileria orientalis strain Shintoku]|uniref:Uncharacterized protein n=1 Tax=Theileria orientalis strain Shintoku TaxID=869250 RepID=J7M4T3_THEOR|nr:conserved hypothetical protein [Theileria orientalis strain Shintoku]BAM42500.1 conserved hypothetical protein [Theileria orientalis strain Shintoku]|eukprot:XP_009692801.1 conserved hypothetical protein [Theileria orientalis strain Shintoku]
MFEYNSKYSKVCKDTDIYNVEPLGSAKGSYVVLNKKMFEDVSDDVEFNVGFECAGDETTKESNSLYELLEKATQIGNWISINPVGTSFKATYCWTLRKKVNKENSILLGRLKRLGPKEVKYRTVQCHTNGSIQPDNYSSIFYPGDVIPAKQADISH